MKVPGVKAAKKFGRWLQARLRGGALILGYHRISTAKEDKSEISVALDNFAGQMEVLRTYTHPISLAELVQRLKGNSLPSRLVAVTFDDGYADNLYLARPILEKYEIPATVFVCTGCLGREFWWDELDRLVLSSRADPSALRVLFGGAALQWDPPRAGSRMDDPELRRQFRRALYHWLLPLDIDDQNRAMDAIRSWSGLSSETTQMARAMSETELLQLANSDFIEIGAHTRSHPVLPDLSFERQREEVEVSKRELEMLLGRPVTGFAYPNGRATGGTKQIVRQAGFAYACTSQHDVVRPGGNLFELTRFWQPDVDADEFLRRLNRWMT